MVSSNAMPIVLGDHFNSIFEASDTDNLAIDDEIENYLRSNPDGLTLKYNDKTYALKMDQVSLNYQLYRTEGNNLVLVDANVQINSRFTPDGFIEIGGLTPNGDRIFIGRSPDSDQEEIIAFVEQHDISSVSSKPTGATVLYGGQSVVEDPLPPVEDLEPTQPAQVADDYVWFSGLADGDYYSDGESFYSAGGELLGECVYPSGNYRVENGQGYIQHTADQQTIYLPIDTYNGGYVMSGVYKDQAGSPVEGSELSFQFLTDLGISVENIDVPYVFPGLDGKDILFTVGPLDSADAEDSWENFVFVDGKVIGKSSFEAGDYSVRDGITYKNIASQGAESSVAVDPFDGALLES